jgi:hypothetical protein
MPESSELRFVFDTNVVISALLLRRSVSRQAFDRAISIGKLLISHATVAELNQVLSKQKFRKYITREESVEFLNAFVQNGIMVEVTRYISICRDPRDDKFIELAIAGQAKCIVTGDKDLLNLHPFGELAILTPRQFLEFSIAGAG